MIDRSLKEELTSRRFEGEFIIPSYENFCLSNVPPTVAAFFGLDVRRPTLPKRYISDKFAVEDPQNIVLMVLDGFGYAAWLQMISDGGFFQTVTERGLVFPITTVFPSATAAALTSLSTGLTPQEHGLPEWYVYIRELDMIIATLPFSPMGAAGRDVLLGKMDPRSLFSGQTLYRSLQKAKIDSIALLPSLSSNSAYTRVALSGSRTIPYQSLTEYAILLRKMLKSLHRRTLVCAYWDSIDSTAHKYGPNTEEWRAEISTISQVLTQEFLKKIDKETAGKTLLIVTADHGQINVNPAETIYLNGYRNVVKDFQKSRRGNAILPSWSARDVSLHLSEDRIHDAKTTLSERLKDKAVVLTTKEATKIGLFGLKTPSNRFIQRSGNVLILPRRNGTIWYHHPNGKRFQFLGAHGGLSEEEILIPFAISKLSELAGA